MSEYVPRVSRYQVKRLTRTYFNVTHVERLVILLEIAE